MPKAVAVPPERAGYNTALHFRGRLRLWDSRLGFFSLGFAGFSEGFAVGSKARFNGFYTLVQPSVPFWVVFLERALLAVGSKVRFHGFYTLVQPPFGSSF